MSKLESSPRPTVANDESGGGSPALRKAVRQRRRSENLAGYLFLLPWLIGLAVLTVGPMIASLYMSFTDYSLLSSPTWVGLDNYERMFTQDERYLNSLQVTFIYVGLSVPLSLAAALAVALALNRGIRGLSLYRAAFYLPSLLGAGVAIAIVWRQVFGRDGLVNAVLAIFGVEHGSWINDPDTALYTLVALAVWQFGAPMVIFLAGLKQIPQELYEAAAIDGAGKLTQFRKVTMPMLSPVLFFNLVLGIIGAFKTFTPAFIISGGSGGPADSTMFYTLYLYTRAFVRLEMGYASAIAWVLLAIIAMFTGIAFATSRYWVHYENKG